MSEKTIVLKNTKAQMFPVPAEDQITEVETLSGKNPRMENLRDRPEWDGMKIIILKAELKKGTIPDTVTGEIHDYYIMATLIYPEDEKIDPEVHGHLVNTAAGNIFARVSDAILERAFPIRGTLRKSGRAWFID